MMRSPKPTLVRRFRTTTRAALIGTIAIGGAGTLLASPTASEAVAATESASRRVDLATPTFSHPKKITNPLFPIKSVEQAVQLGAEGDVALRHEITRLPGTRVFTWKGQRVKTVRSQFVAYGNGRILEVAVDYFAQADDGSVWYFGETVDNYEDGVIANHDGTWFAGKDGPPGMIMPAHPEVGDVYRPENIPGLVFEEVTVKAVNQTVPGPRGPVRGAVKVQERLLDGTLEDKVFAPGYGEFEASVPSSDEMVTVAIAVPTDQRGGSPDPSIAGLPAIADQIFRDAGAPRPGRIGALDAEVRQAAVDAGLAGLDLTMQYQDPSVVDEARLAVWRNQLVLDRQRDDAAGIASDRTVIAAIRARINS